MAYKTSIFLQKLLFWQFYAENFGQQAAQNLWRIHHYNLHTYPLFGLLFLVYENRYIFVSTPRQL